MTPLDTIVLPDSKARFDATAMRLAALAPGHSMANWLSFMSRISSAQQLAVVAVSTLEGIASPVVDLALDARIPPVQAERHHRNPVWRTALSHILDTVEVGTSPSQARHVIARLRAKESAALEALADQFLLDEVQNVDVELYVAAALQVYFTVLAAKLPASRLRLLPQHGLCPSCGSTPSAGLIAAEGNLRYLYCSLCSTAWRQDRGVCITCGNSTNIIFHPFDGDTGVVKAETCNRCFSYSKMIYQKRNSKSDPYADDFASLGLDSLLAEAGWSRHPPNPLLKSTSYGTIFAP